MNKIVYIDTETTGVDPKSNGIIQLAGAVEINGKIKDRFDFKVKPFPQDKIVDKALEVNGITRDELKTFESPSTVHRKFTSLLYKHVSKFDKYDKLQFVGYNSIFDGNFVREFFYKNGDKFYGSLFFNPTICVMEQWALLLRNERHKLVNFKLGTVYEYVFKKEAKDLHDAMNDIEYTRELYLKGLEYLKGGYK